MESFSLTHLATEFANRARAQRSVLLLFFLFITFTGLAQDAFITTWQTTVARESITIGTFLSANYTVDWGDGTVETNRTSSATHIYETPGIHTVSITGDFSRFSASRGRTEEKLLTVEQWGTLVWNSLSSAFAGCENLEINATDTPILTNVTSMRSMFDGASSVNVDLNSWDVSNVTDMSSMFKSASAFNGDISSWDVSSVTTMENMFRDASAFNADISAWDVSKVMKIESMFRGTTSMAFNQDISNWEVGQLNRFSNLFYVSEGIGAFDQNIGSWDMSFAVQAFNMLTNTSLSVDNYDATLVGWAKQDLRLTFIGVTGLKYCALGAEARETLILGGLNFQGDERNETCPPQLVSAIKDSDTQITVTFTENVETNGGNPADFTVVDGDVNNYPVTAQADGTAGDMEIVLTVADLSGATSDLQVSYTNNNNEIFDPVTGNARTSINPVIIDITAPVMEIGTRDSNTELTITFNEPILTLEGNPTDFTVTDDQNNAYAVSGQIAGTEVTDIVLTVADLSLAIGNLTVTYTNNNDEISNLTGINMTTDATGIVLLDEVTPVMVSAAKDSDTQITLTFSEPIQTNEGNPIDFTVADGTGAQYIVSAQFDGTAMDTDLLLTVADLSAATGGLTITYTNNNDEVSDFGSNALDTDAQGVHLVIISDPNAFVSTWRTTRDNQARTIQTNTDNGEVYNYTINWGDGSTADVNQQGNASHVYAAKGIYAVSITGDFPRMGTGSFFLLTIEQWGDIAWTSFEAAFRNSTNLQINATDAPDLSGVTSLASMFNACAALNADFNHWDVSGITDMSEMFRSATVFNGDISGWDVSSVENMSTMFMSTSAFNGDLSSWVVSSVTDMKEMFRIAIAFDADISQWNVSNVTNMAAMFSSASLFNTDITGWNVSNVTDMNAMFFSTNAFNQDISGWDVSTVIDMSDMFRNANAFNQPIGTWDVSAVTNMTSMFNGNTVFNQDISIWHLAKVTTLSNMFNAAEAFNQDLSNWDVTGVTNMTSLFSGATIFDQSLGDWDITGVTSMTSMLANAGLSVANYDATLVGWAEQDLINPIAIHVTGLKYCTAGALARETLGDKGWRFFGDEANDVCFPIAIDATKDSDTQITIEFSESVQTGGGNPTDFTVTDEANNGYLVTGQADGTAGDAEIVLTLADLSAAVGDLTVTYTNNNDEIVGLISGPVDTTIKGIVIDITPPVMVSGVRDSNTQLTIEFSDQVQTNEGNPTDFTVVDEANSSYPVLAQLDDVVNDIRIVLTMPDLTLAIGSLTVTYANNNDEINNFLGSIMVTDATGIQVLDESNPVLISAVKDSDTQITLIFNEPVQTNGTNPTDFIVLDGAGNAFAVTGQADGTAQDTEIILTVANISTAIGGVTVTYTNNSDEIRDFGSNSLETDETGAFISIIADPQAFVTTWEVTSDGGSITIPTAAKDGEIYNYTVDWGDGNVDVAQTENAVHSYTKAGMYTVSITGTFPRIYFEKFSQNNRSIQTVEQWGNIAWTSFNNAFTSCLNMEVRATDAPDLSSVTDLTNMFSSCRVMNADISHWDVSNVTNMQGLFASALSFDQDLANWDVSNVKDMWKMFSGAAVFDQYLGDWDIRNVESMPQMLSNSGLSVSNYDATLVGWAAQDVQPDVSVGATGLKYCIAGEIARDFLKEKGWFFNSDEYNFECAPIMLTATKDTDTQITVSFNEGVLTGGTNPTDFTVTDDADNTYTVSAQEALSSGSTDIKLTVVNLSTATGDLKVTYINNNNEISDASTEEMFVDTDLRGVVIDLTAPVMLRATRDSDTQIIVVFDDFVQTAGGNPTDFVVKDEANNAYLATAQSDGIIGDKNIRLNVADMSLAIGDLTITYTNNNNEIKNLNGVAMATDATGIIVIDNVAPIMVSATKDSDTQITVTFNEPVQTNGGNPIDFMVADGRNDAYVVTGQADGTASDTEIILTVDDLSAATGGLTITYSNNNDEISDFGNNIMVTDEQGVHLSIYSDASAFVTTWRTTEDRERVTLFTEDENGEVYNYTIDWGDGRVDANKTGDALHSYFYPGTYTVIITGEFPRILGGRNDQSKKLMTIEQWGTTAWTSFKSAFSQAVNLRINATDIPDLSKVIDMSSMFINAQTLNADFTGWDVSGVKDMSLMFNNCYSLVDGVSSWDVSSVTNMSSMFSRAFSFNGDLSAWQVGNVTNMSSMFSNARSFNRDLILWDVSKVTAMGNMFFGASSFNEDISDWNVSSVEGMTGMFYFSSFNGDISRWNVSSVTSMSGMFGINEVFKGDLSTWDVSSVTNMNDMFLDAKSFNADISGWDVSNVTNMSKMFSGARSFNQDIGGWDVSNLTLMQGVFDGAGAFDQNLGGWDVSGFSSMGSFLDNTNLSVDNYDATLIGWAAQEVSRGVFFGAEGLKYCSAGEAAREILTNGDNLWSFFGDERATLCPPVLVSATKDNNTQITAIFSDNVQTNEGNPADFTVTDGTDNAFTVTAQSDAVVGDKEIILTVADLSTSLGDLMVTYTNNNDELSDVSETFLAPTSGPVTIDLDNTAPTLMSAVKISDTEISLVLSEPVQTNEGNTDDFTLTDDATNTYAVITQADDTAQDNKITLTVADISGATGTLTLTYTNNNSEVSDFGGNELDTDATGVAIVSDATPPTVAISSLASDPANGAFDITITFSEDVVDFIIADLIVSNGTAGNLTGSGAVYTATISPVADGAVTVDIAAAVVQDAAGNDNTAAMQFSIENDATDPTVTITTMDSDPTSGAFDVTFTFSEDVTGFDVADMSVDNGVASNFAGSGAVYTATITPTADGTITVDVAAALAQDAAGNDNSAATQFSIENDETDPTVTITTMDSDPTSGAFDVTFTFSEDVTAFTVADVSVDNGVASNFTGAGAAYTATITPSADGTVTVDVAANVTQDAAGNDNIAAAQFSIENDETAPTVLISSTANTLVNAAFDITITFSEEVTDFALVDLAVANGTASNLSGSGSVYTATITPAADGLVTVDVSAATVQDLAGNDNTAATQLSIQADITDPTAPIITGMSDDTGSDNADGITSDQTLSFTGTAEANSTVEVFLGGSSIGNTSTDGSGNWTYDHSSTSLIDGSYNITATATDAAGNTSPLSGPFAIIIDTVIPTEPAITGISDDNGISNADYVTNDPSIIFSGTAEPLSSVGVRFPAGNVRYTTADSNGDWVFDFSHRDFFDGTYLFSVTATDVAGNASITSDVINLVIDTVAPDIASITRADVNPTTANSVDFTVTFSEEAHGLSTTNFELVFTDTQNASIGSLSASSGTSITVTVDNITGSGSFGLNLSNVTGITDLAGNALSGTLTGEVYNTNFIPTDISLSASSILENNAIGDLIASLSTSDTDAGDSHTYSLVAGTGDTDNASFTISGDALKAAEAFDLETKSSYALRIQTDDGRGGTFEKAFAITIDNVPEADLRITGNNAIPATPLGITTTFDITIHNDGDATLTVGSILYPTAFGGPVAGIVIPASSSTVVTMLFTPTVAQLYTGDITIITNGGTGILAVSADGAIITSVDDGLLKAEAINLYPNPASDIVTIDLSKYNGKTLDIQLYDLSGIKTFSISNYQQSTLKLDVSGYQNGLYLMQFSDGKSTVQKKIMIRK